MSNGDGESVRKSTGVRSEGGKGSESQQTEYGLFNQAWECHRLSEICLKKNGIQTGPFGSQLHKKDYVRNGTPIITVEHLGENRILNNNIPMVSNEDRDRLNKYKIKKGDILFSRVGSVDRRSIVRQEEDGWLFSGRCLRVRPQHSLIDPEYLSYFFGLSEFKDYIRRIAVGATMPSLNTKLLSDVPIYHPPLPEQRAIAHILGTLDDKIELNRRMNETLEAMARAIFKSWFVDFDPVRAKAEGRPTGLPDEIAALFPDSFEESELGEIPRGWEVKSLDEVAKYLNGLALQKYPPEGEDYLPVIKIAQLRSGNTEGADKASPNLDPAYIIEDGDIIFSWSGSLTVVLWCGGQGALNQHLFKVSSNYYPKWFYYLWTLHHLPEFQAIAAGKATTMGHIQRHHLSDAKVLTPSDKQIEIMGKFLSPLIERVIANKVQSRTLTALRDTLLPKLISGELRIPDAERFIEEGGV